MLLVNLSSLSRSVFQGLKSPVCADAGFAPPALDCEERFKVASTPAMVHNHDLWLKPATQQAAWNS